ncbi:MAG: hypothetical protein AUI50_07995 [Crenarchaeota archaeon 13_1_40CM_2_52_14]|nr:MAG: hypothetical protein AUI50_07995 [Crenarchaeota archaeon 13_1_40CM_2_52_14]
MEKPSWTPIVLSGAIPREATDLLAILVMGIVALETSFATIGPAAFNSRLWLSLLVVPPTCALASVSTTTRRTREELALFAYGGSGWQILLRYFLRGAIIALVAFSPMMLQGFLATASIFEVLVPAIILFSAGGLFYSLPSLRRIQSSSFVENYKS